MIPLSALSPEELSSRLGLSRAYRGRQLFEWLHVRLAFSFEEMSSLPLAARETLRRTTSLLTLERGDPVSAPDGTVKFRFALHDGHAIESVLLRDEKGRYTACLSTQSGCGMACRFCRTGQLGLRRDLADHEIVEQFLMLRQHVSLSQLLLPMRGVPAETGHQIQEPKVPQAGIDTVVFMGMGEPLANLRAVRRAIGILCHPAGSALSLRRLTVSTCGLVEGIEDLAESGPHVRLAVSLITADPPLRRTLMPVAAANPLPELRRALLRYQAATGKRLTLEIVLMEGINDRSRDVNALLAFVDGAGGTPLKVLVNLIAWNEVPGMVYQRPAAARMRWFERQLREARVPAAVRASRGGAVAGACGQLG